MNIAPDLDELARDLGYRLDVLLLRQELKDKMLTPLAAVKRVDALAATYGVTKDEVRQRIGGTHG